ncbi:H+/gluconate symporter-like permease [Endozoicomonas sp. NE40]|uniref:H+/gluconate symporter-like permease n=2 Tax=Endozoicomonas lisbonensis TaxID=3120522 RepID=A0ABV2SDK2_9GAMM
MLVAQIVMGITLLLMISGRTPLYLTAIVGSFITAMIAGFPMTGGEGPSVTSLINGGLNPVIADMAGVLMFIGVMERVGFLDVIIRNIIKVGRRLGGGAGVATAGGIAAGFIGMLTGFTQPAITAVLTGAASSKLGVNPSKSAGVHAHAGHLGNFGGFTHPTQVAVVAITGIGFGMINVYGVLISLAIFAFSFMRLRKETAKNGPMTDEEVNAIAKEFESSEHNYAFWKTMMPFLVLMVGFVLGYPIFVVGVLSSIVTMVLSATCFSKAEQFMLNGVGRIATPLVATIGFLFMSSVINNIGMADSIANLFRPMLTVAPLQSMLIVAGIASFITQSNGASAAISIPFLQAVMTAVPEASPLGLAVMAAGGGAVMQYYLTGGPVAALATVIPVIKGSELKEANLFQRPAMLFGMVLLLAVSFFF